MSRFVELPAERVIGMVDALANFEGVTIEWITKGNERVARIAVGQDFFHFYTSIAMHATRARKCGTDAARIVYRRQTQKILRTAPQGESDRAGAWLKRVRAQLLERIEEIKSKPHCPQCNRAMVRRSGKFGSFWGCQVYPKCTGTRKV